MSFELGIMAVEKGSSGISLHVFGHNKAAISMYESLGYYATNIIMKDNIATVRKPRNRITARKVLDSATYIMYRFAEDFCIHDSFSAFRAISLFMKPY